MDIFFPEYAKLLKICSHKSNTKTYNIVEFSK